MLAAYVEGYTQDVRFPGAGEEDRPPRRRALLIYVLAGYCQNSVLLPVLTDLPAATELGLSSSRVDSRR